MSGEGWAEQVGRVGIARQKQSIHAHTRLGRRPVAGPARRDEGRRGGRGEGRGRAAVGAWGETRLRAVVDGGV